MLRSVQRILAEAPRDLRVRLAGCCSTTCCAGGSSSSRARAASGKSVVGTALALAARDRGKRVLLIEIDTPVSAARFLGANPSLGHVETEVLPGLFMVNLDPAHGHGRVRARDGARGPASRARSWTTPSTTGSSPPRPACPS